MRTMIAMLALAAGLGLAPLAATAAPVAATNAGAAQSLVEPAQYGGGYCARLRRACQFKEERGEGGLGNCRRYRDECGSRVSYCEQLRRACIYKSERGQWGEGNCRRYRAECGR